MIASVIFFTGDEPRCIKHLARAYNRQEQTPHLTSLLGAYRQALKDTLVCREEGIRRQAKKLEARKTYSRDCPQKEMAQQIRHQPQEQAPQPLAYYQRTPILNQRLDKIRSAPQEQVTEGPVVFQSSIMSTQQTERSSAISQVQVSQVPSSFQSSTTLLPRLEYNQATSQIQLTQPSSTFQSSSSSTQRVNVNQGISSAQRMDNTHGNPYAQHVDNNPGHSYGPRIDNISGTSNMDNCTPVFSTDPCGPSAAACSPRMERNCGPETATSSCCSFSKCLMGGMGLLSAIWIGIAVAQIVLGVVYLDTCPLQSLGCNKAIQNAPWVRWNPGPFLARLVDCREHLDLPTL
ncbi:hypothetical protein NDU88_003641 [Pleurodeles waltl]|uniref:Uncharacterized protein n=1 Tax=Pleurodeles waltl TaxID=8319 RepID=A0AAV7MRA6_PLEWA|nr:hypothetical protein NDU88_003641 [Pleurodeles waltl]